MCLYPRLIPNPKYRTSKKRGYYKPSPHDARLNYVPVACGKCYECRKKKARACIVTGKHILFKIGRAHV